MTTRIFGIYYYDSTDPRLDELADLSVDRYDLYLLCDTDIPYDDTWDRSGNVNRDDFQNLIIEDLTERDIQYRVIQGSMDERVQQVQQILTGSR